MGLRSPQLALLFSALLLLGLVSGCGADGTGSGTDPTETGSGAGTTAGASPEAPATGADDAGGDPGTTTERSPGMGEANPRVALKTSKGDITLELDPAKAPATVENFLSYARDGFYDGTIFHRVIPNFMIQGGGFTPDMEQKPTNPTIKNEAGNGLKNSRGTIAMARTQVVDSASSQFFINTVDNASLDHRDESPGGFGYAVFGRVIEGMETVDAISAVPTTNRGFFQDVPAEPVVIEQVTVLE
jgi:cyclophilin family peptidyl-prolyl cis-trans isomerase